MQDVLLALEASGWRLLSSHDCDVCSDDPFKLEDNEVEWGLARDASEPTLRIKFRAVGARGERTKNLSDIHYCFHHETGETLHFEKRMKPEWRQGVTEFVDRLNEWAQSVARKP
jgi:hypothetical protein